MSPMTVPEPLVVPEAGWSTVPAGLPLIALLQGYRDAGNTIAQTIDTVRGAQPPQLVASFSADLLLDFRARRPLARIEGTKVTHFRRPRLDLRLLRDEMGQDFLLLSGFEPDFRWDSFTQALRSIVDHFAVSSFTWAHAIPMPVPHTRPTRLAVTGNRDEITEQLSVWEATVEAPAHVLHQLEFELTPTDTPIADLVVLVPHYLADGQMPAGALRLLEALGTATGLIFSTSELRERDREFRAEFDASLSDNEEAQRLIAVLETQHDGFLKGTPQENPFADADGELPTADSIAAELERYLNAQSDDK